LATSLALRLTQALIRSQPGARLLLDVRYLAGRRHLPIVALKRAA
jgi:hypothetical protein